MKRLNKEEKLKIYNLWKNGYSPKYLAKTYGMQYSNFQYFIKLIDCYGPEILDRGYRHYSSEEKEKIILEALRRDSSFNEISLKYALPSRGMLTTWVKEYRNNGYVIVERKKGRPSMKKSNKTKAKKKPVSDSDILRQKDMRILELEAEIAYLKKKEEVLRQMEEESQQRGTHK